jgi:carboxymethylenebutenolidase
MDPAEMERLWDAHTAGEFVAQDVDATLATMVAEPYVMHLPTLVGAQGGPGVRTFYTEVFIPEVPADFVVESVSRTVGAERIVDEMIVSMTHDREVSWILPGVPATGRRIEVGVVG